MIIGALVLKGLRSVSGAVLGEYADDVLASAKNAFADTLEGMISGRRSIEEWGEIVTPLIDQTAAGVVQTENVRYVGGRLTFTVAKNPNKINIAYALYFIDDDEQWTKQTATSDVKASNFTKEALDEISKNGEVIFELTEGE